MKTLAYFCLLIAATSALPTAEKDPKVVGGRDARRHEAPYIVSFKREFSNGIFHVCGGSIITQDWILTAAHCIYFDEEYFVFAGKHEFWVSGDQEQMRTVVERKIHADFDISRTGPRDVGLAKLDSPLTFVSGVVERINLPPRGLISSGNVQLFGWGSTSDNMDAEVPDVLQTVVKPILPWEICEEIVNTLMTHRPFHFTNFCTGPLEGGKSGCHG
jgi:hypothetical protein